MKGIRRIPHLAKAIDLESEYASKYLELIAAPGKCAGASEDHHIVPVAFYADVLGITTCRQAGSPDMVRNNIVTLSKGQHLVAHYYLLRCARQCIKAQMYNAFRRMYNNRGEWEDDEVLRVAKEMDEYYASLKGKPIPHKDGVQIIRRANHISVDHWKDGRVCGTSVKMRPNGKLIEVWDHETDMCVQLEYGYSFHIYHHNRYPERSSSVTINPIGFDVTRTEYSISITDKGSATFSCSFGNDCHYDAASGRLQLGPGYNLYGCHAPVHTEEFKKLVNSMRPIAEAYIPLMDFKYVRDPMQYFKVFSWEPVVQLQSKVRDAGRFPMLEVPSREIALGI